MDHESDAGLERIKELFARLHGLDLAERAELLDAACAGDPQLRVQVQQLLDNYSSAVDFFAQFPELLLAASDVRKTLRAFSDGEIVSERFRIVGLLGEGGMGEVYEAEDLVLRHEHVALKTLRASLAADESAIERLSRELRLARRITHPNVCRVHDVYQHRTASNTPILFFTMELLKGSNLAELLRTGPMSPTKALPVAMQMAAAVDAAHVADVVHGDFKPGNIMLVASEAGRERVVVTDFGLARWLPVGSALLSTTRDSHQWGTPVYMAPEQLLGGKVTRSTDIYALGVVLYEMVTGHQPFSVDSPMLLALRKLRHAPRPPREYAADLDPRWQAVILRCLDADPAKRFETATDAVRALEGGQQRTFRWWIPGAAALACGGMLAIPPVRGGLNAASSKVTGYFASQQTIVVLPFAEEKLTPENQALSLGLTVAVTDDLRKLAREDHRFSVAPAAEVIDTGVDTPALVQQTLGANVIVTGRVVHASDRTVVTVAVNDMSRHDSPAKPSQTIEIEPDDHGLLEARIVTVVAAALGMRPSPAARQELGTGTGQPAAERSYLLGRGYLMQGPLRIASAIDAFGDASRRDEQYAEAFAGLGEAYLQQYETTRDPKFIEDALFNANAANARDPSSARSHLIRGRVYRASAQNQRAIQEFLTAIELDADLPDTRSNLARVYDADGKIELAEQMYREETRRHPKYWSGYEELGAFLSGRGRYHEAEESFVTGSRYAPANPRAVVNLAGVYEIQERFGAAEAELKNGLRKAPNAASLYNNLAWIFIFEGKLDEAVDTLEQAVKLPSADSIVIWSSLARALRWDGKHGDDERAAYKRALELADDRVRVNPFDRDTRSNRAYLLAELGRGAEAKQEIATTLATEGARGNVTILFRSAMVQELLGDRKGALEALESAARGGYPISRIARDPDVRELRKDSGYSHVLDVAAQRTKQR